MTKQYKLKLCSNGTYYLHHKGVLINNPYITFDKFHKEDAESIVSELNHLSEENEQLKQQLKECEQKKQNIKELLICGEAVVEQKKLQELIYGQVIALIDDKIKEYKKYDGYDTEKFYIGTQLLKELKKELQ